MDEQERQSLGEQEENIPKIYKVEGTPVQDITEYFPAIAGKSFIEWIEYLSQTPDTRILEIGGGIHQSAALGILTNHPDIRYTALEPRILVPSSRKQLTKFPHYQYIQGGLSILPEVLRDQHFDLVFANSVAEHLPLPYSLVQQAYPFLKEDCPLFANGIPVFQKAWAEKIKEVQEKGFQIAYFKEEPDPQLLSKDITNVSLALIKKGILLNLASLTSHKVYTYI